ncbi:peptidase [Vallitalea longa]|uniref:Peptidase n=1 Tax=Vallitalea longa TaxID=2936439 RepID=A0A9W5Y9P1_9FIRM|nr:TldD/PmbA family protein [Vallitalea longa]GKX29875.1 peptidase [Vallitalea longa]
MDKKKFIKLLFEKGRKAGFAEMEIYISSQKKQNINVYNDDVDSFENSVSEGLSFRGLYNNKKMGFSYTEKIDESTIDMLIREAMENAKVLDNDDIDIIYEGSKEYKDIVTYNKQSENVPVEEKIKYLKQIENMGQELDSRVKSITYNMINDATKSIMIANTKGLNLKYKSNLYKYELDVDIEDHEDVKSAYRYQVTNDFTKLKGQKLINDVISEAVSMLGATSIQSGIYPVIFRSDVSASILDAFASIFSADKVQKNMSLLKGKLGEQVADTKVTIVDDPFMKDGAFTRPFDAEGVATKYKKIIKKGILTTYFHNLKTANKDNVQPTGNAYKTSFNTAVDIAPTNMYIEIGKKSYDELIQSTKKGLLIIDVQGLHSGLNPISGDFSVSAYGYEIIDGKITRPVNQITIAGNYIELLMNIEDIGNDLEFILPHNGYVGSPSIKVKSLSVAGQ